MMNNKSSVLVREQQRYLGYLMLVGSITSSDSDNAHKSIFPWVGVNNASLCRYEIVFL